MGGERDARGIGADSSDLEGVRAGGYDGWRVRCPRQWDGCWEGGAFSRRMIDGCGALRSGMDAADMKPRYLQP